MANGHSGAKSAVWADLRGVLAGRDFRRLFATRLVSQAGDGIVTAGVGTYVFFNATTFPSPAAGAAAFAVLYLPYSLIGPFAGVFIDRWSRRQILVRSALLRSVFVVLTAAFMALGNRGALLYVAVLLVLGVNRFFLSSLSVALPHVVAEDKLVMANSVSPTIGGISATIGGIVALGLNVATGNTERGAAITLLFGGACSGLGGAYLSIVYNPSWVEGMTAGRGWIALALVVFATWKPWRVLAGAYLFGGVTLAQFQAQALGVDVPAQYLSMLPYVATLVVLAIMSRDAATIRLNAPASLGRPFHRDG